MGKVTFKSNYTKREGFPLSLFLYLELLTAFKRIGCNIE